MLQEDTLQFVRGFLLGMYRAWFERLALSYK
jgi:hypothetical protein